MKAFVEEQVEKVIAMYLIYLDKIKSQWKELRNKIQKNREAPPLYKDRIDK
jgi:hypothetical protein